MENPYHAPRKLFKLADVRTPNTYYNLRPPLLRFLQYALVYLLLVLWLHCTHSHSFPSPPCRLARIPTVSRRTRSLLCVPWARNAPSLPSYVVQLQPIAPATMGRPKRGKQCARHHPAFAPSLLRHFSGETLANAAFCSLGHSPLFHVTMGRTCTPPEEPSVHRDVPRPGIACSSLAIEAAAHIVDRLRAIRHGA